MGYDLVAKGARRGAVSYYRAGIEFMGVLRAAMFAAGVPEALVYKKFTSNDGWLVTPLQSKTIARKLTTWLHGRNLTLDLAETNSRSHSMLDALIEVRQALGPKAEAARLARRRRGRNLPVRVDRQARKALRAFAAFCAGSGGFRVE